MESQSAQSWEGTARLWIAVPVAVASFFYTFSLDYSLPLYFDALNVPKDTWSDLVKYKVTAWIFGSALAGLLARRYGERLVWSGALLGKLVVLMGLIYFPTPLAIKSLSAWQGFTGALMWIAGVSLVQMVPAKRKGISNAMIMMSLGVGSVIGTLVSRSLIYRGELSPFFHGGDYGGIMSRLFNFTSFTSTPQVADFLPIFWLLFLTSTVSSIAVGIWGQHPGRFQLQETPSWNQTLSDLVQLARNPKFWALVIPLALLGGPVFQASNQFLPYRAEDLGLKLGSEDRGWVWLKLLQTSMWIPGGAAVGLLAGRRAPGLAGVAMLATFSLSAMGIGLSTVGWQIFISVGIFECARQFMRWSHAGYMSEHMPDNLRATAIGCTIMFSGLGSAIYSWIAPAIWNPIQTDFESSTPIMAAAILGLAGAVGLWTYDFFRPIRKPDSTATT